MESEKRPAPAYVLKASKAAGTAVEYVDTFTNQDAAVAAYERHLFRFPEADGVIVCITGLDIYELSPKWKFKPFNSCQVCSGWNCTLGNSHSFRR